MGANFVSFDDRQYSEYLYVAPSDELDFTEGEITSADGAIVLQCGRTSVARQFNAAGGIEVVNPGVVRFKRHPLTGAIVGLLAEPAATNVLSFNSQLTNSYWPKHNCVVAASTVKGLDGAAMFKMADDAVNTYHGMPSPLTSIGSSSWASGRVFAKAGENNFIQLELGFPDWGSFNATVNLTDGSFVTGGTSPAPGRANVTPCKNGVYLIEISARSGAAASQSVRLSVLNHNGSTTTYAGTAGNGVYVQYPQLELSPRSTSTIVTDNGPVTRDADNYSFPLPEGYDSRNMSFCVEAVPAFVPLAPYAGGDATSGVLAMRNPQMTGATSVMAVIGRQIATQLPQAFARSVARNITLLGNPVWQTEPVVMAYSTTGIFSNDGNVLSADAGFVQAASQSIQVGSSRPEAEYFEGAVTGVLLYKGALNAYDLAKATQ